MLSFVITENERLQWCIAIAATSSMPLEILHLPLMLLRRFAVVKRAEIAPLPRLFVRWRRGRCPGGRTDPALRPPTCRCARTSSSTKNVSAGNLLCLRQGFVGRQRQSGFPVDLHCVLVQWRLWSPWAAPSPARQARPAIPNMLNAGAACRVTIAGRHPSSQRGCTCRLVNQTRGQADGKEFPAAGFRKARRR